MTCRDFQCGKQELLDERPEAARDTETVSALESQLAQALQAQADAEGFWQEATARADDLEAQASTPCSPRQLFLTLQVCSCMDQADHAWIWKRQPTASLVWSANLPESIQCRLC